MNSLLKIKLLIRKILNEKTYANYDKLHKPTEAMVNVANMAMQNIGNNEEIKNKIKSINKNEGSGLEKANDIINRESMTHEQVKRMDAFFTANQTLKNTTPENLLRWNLWGGDAGQNWAKTILNQTSSSNNSSRKIRDSEVGGNPINTTTFMDPTNTRTATAYSNIKNQN